jgi:hypothetical protein
MKKKEEIQSVIRHQDLRIQQNNREINDLQQYSHRWNVRVQWGRLEITASARCVKYYAKAIRSNTHSATDMENAVWGTVFHCCSTDEDPQKGAESWCFNQRAQARHEPIPPQENKQPWR